MHWTGGGKLKFSNLDKRMRDIQIDILGAVNISIGCNVVKRTLG